MSDAYKGKSIEELRAIVAEKRASLRYKEECARVLRTRLRQLVSGAGKAALNTMSACRVAEVLAWGPSQCDLPRPPLEAIAHEANVLAANESVQQALRCCEDAERRIDEEMAKLREEEAADEAEEEEDREIITAVFEAALNAENDRRRTAEANKADGDGDINSTGKEEAAPKK